jgi:uncharacterized membrane protein (GlpM family)
MSIEEDLKMTIEFYIRSTEMSIEEDLKMTIEFYIRSTEMSIEEDLKLTIEFYIRSTEMSIEEDLKMTIETGKLNLIPHFLIINFFFFLILHNLSLELLVEFPVTFNAGFLGGKRGKQDSVFC